MVETTETLEGSNAVEVAEVVEVPGVAPFVLARVGSLLVKLAEAPVEGAGEFSPVIEGVAFVTHENALSLSKEQLGELYGEVAGVPTKKFKDKNIAVESLVYQVGKMKVFDPSAPKVAPAAAAAKGEKQPKAPKEPKAPKVSKYEFLTPPVPEAALKGLPPQAVALVSAITDVVKASGSSTFGTAELEARLNAADSPLTTKQPALRIFGYYLGKLKDSGFIKEA